MIKKTDVNTLIKSKLFFLTLSFLTFIACSDKILKKQPSPHRTNIIRSTATQRRSSRRQVIPEKININSEFYGPFSKNRLEIIFNNPSITDSIKAEFTFNLNKNTFLKNIHLETDGVLEKFDNFKFDSLSRIYKCTKEQGGDFIQLHITENGQYYIKLFPVLKNRRCKVIIEYYTTLGTDENSSLIWKFLIRPSTQIIMSVNAKMPFGTSIETKSRAYKFSDETNNKLKFEISDSTSLKLKFSFNNINNITRYFNDNIQFFLLNDKHILPDKNYRLKTQSILKYPDKVKILELLTTFKKPSEEINIPKYVDFDDFGENFIKFLIKEKSLHISKFYIDIGAMYYSSFWLLKFNNWYYYDDDISIVSRIKQEYSQDYETYDIHYPFLDEFMKYNQTLLIDRDLINNSEYIFYRTSSRNKIHRGFIPIDVAPTPLGGYRTIQKNVTYPKEALEKEIEGNVILQCFVTKNGNVNEVKILKSDNDLLNGAAINTVKKTLFCPARQRDRYLGMWISIPVMFKFEMNNSKKSTELSKKQFECWCRKFEFQQYEENEILTEVGFDSSNTTIIDYMSREHFELMFNHPEIIKYGYYNGDVALALDDDKTEWVFIKRPVN